MPRSKYLRYSDEQLQILLCIAGYGPLAQKELSIATGIEKGNLSSAIKVLRGRGVLTPNDSCKTKESYKTKKRGRPLEYLALKSPYLIQDICDELEYRKNQHEIKMKELESCINQEFWAEWSTIAKADDEKKQQEFLDKYTARMVDRLNMGATDGSVSVRAHRVDDGGKPTIVWHHYNGIHCSTREISYQGINYWLRRLQSPLLRVLCFLMDHPKENYSKKEIAEGAALDLESLNVLLKLKTLGHIVTAQKDQAETYKLNIQSQKVIELMDTIGLRKVALEKELLNANQPAFNR